MIRILLFDSAFHSRVLLPYSCQCLITEIFVWNDRSYITKIPNIFYIIYLSRSLTVDFILFFLFIFILLYFSFFLNFLFLEQLRLGLSVTLSHQSQIDGVVTRLITGEVEGTRIKVTSYNMDTTC